MYTPVHKHTQSLLCPDGKPSICATIKQHSHSLEVTSDRCGSVTVMTNTVHLFCFPQASCETKGRGKHIITMFRMKDRLTTPHYQYQGEIVNLLLLDRRGKWDQTAYYSVGGTDMAFYKLSATRGEMIVILTICTRICACVS